MELNGVGLMLVPTGVGMMLPDRVGKLSDGPHWVGVMASTMIT